MYQKEECKSVYTDEEQKPGPKKGDPEWTNVIVSKAAFLLGVPEKYFDEEQPFDPEIFRSLLEEKPARIIRNLCILRTAIMKKSGEISTEITHNMKNLSRLPDLIPQDALATLEADGIRIEKANCRLIEYSITINELIRSRISACSNLFPNWMNFNYVKSLFIMPKGANKGSIDSEKKRYKENYGKFPFNMYVNWKHDDAGSLLIHDLRFVSRLYEANKDKFLDISKVHDASAATKQSIYDFLKGSDRTAILVDCENSDPYRLYAVLKNLEQKEFLPKIFGIILFDDVFTIDTWKILEDFTSIPVEYREVKRIKADKSRIDQTLTFEAAKLAYRDNVDSFILAASDSDYSSLIEGASESRFLVMVEAEKCGPDIRRFMNEGGIPYCFMNDFCTADISDIKTKAMMSRIRGSVEKIVEIDVRQTVKDAAANARIALTAEEEDSYVEMLLKKIRLVADGEVMRVTL